MKSFYEHGNAYYWCVIELHKSLRFTKCGQMFYVADYYGEDVHLLTDPLKNIWDFFKYTVNYFLERG